MHVSRTWRRLIAPRLRPAAAEPDARDSESPSTRELRQRCLTRLLRRGMPLWSQEPEHCDGCGRALLLGERALLLCRNDELLLACPLCAGGLRDQGYLAVTANAETEAADEGGLSLAS